MSRYRFPIPSNDKPTAHKWYEELNQIIEIHKVSLILIST